MFIDDLKKTTESLGHSLDGKMGTDLLLLSILVTKGVISIEELKELQDYL